MALGQVRPLQMFTKTGQRKLRELLQHGILEFRDGWKSWPNTGMGYPTISSHARTWDPEGCFGIAFRAGIGQCSLRRLLHCTQRCHMHAASKSVASKRVLLQNVGVLRRRTGPRPTCDHPNSTVAKRGCPRIFIPVQCVGSSSCCLFSFPNRPGRHQHLMRIELIATFK